MENQIDARSDCVIALDVGGTSVKSGLVARDGKILTAPQTKRIASEASAGEILQAFCDTAAQYREASGSRHVLGIALAFPGPFDYENGICYIQGLNKFSALYNVSVKEFLYARFQASILFRNDAEAAVVGEAMFGAAHPYARVLGLTLGTGLGSAFLVNRIPVYGGQGIPPNGWLYPMPFQNQRAEDLFSIRGQEARAARANIAFRDPETFAQLARDGNPTARALFIQFGQELGEFLGPFVSAFRADAVLILGGIAGAFDLFERALRETLPIPVLTGQLGASAALFGAAELFFNERSHLQRG